MQRQQVLYQPAKRVQVVMLEGALRARVVSVPTLVGQLDWLLAVIGLPALDLGIIPFEAAVPVFPLSGFGLYDDLVIVESIVGEQQLVEADDVVRYEKYLELLRDATRTGTEAAVIRWCVAVSGCCPAATVSVSGGWAWAGVLRRRRQPRR